MIAGIPKDAEIKNNSTYPKLSTTKPENPDKNFPGTSIKELNRAYCVAVYFGSVKLDKYAIKIVPAKPPVKLSNAIVNINK